jgi:Transposase DDE domain
MTIEPAFGKFRHNKQMNLFTLRGENKVGGQWKRYALVHNIEKWANCKKAA